MNQFGKHPFGDEEFNKRFDAVFEQAQKNTGNLVKTGVRVAVTVWLLNFLLGAVLCGVGYVVFHFLHKFW